MSILKRIAARLPRSVQFELEAQLRASQLRRGRYGSDEPEYERLDEWVRPGDWVLDVGANVGRYTLRLAELVGPAGRVVAFEPVPWTFAQLAAVVGRARCDNVTLVNAAASDRSSVAGMSIPDSRHGLREFTRASLSEAAGGQSVVTLAVDEMPLARPVRFIKVDVEGHEVPALRGMRRLIERDRPILVVEDSGPGIDTVLEPLGYRGEKARNSPNRIFRPLDPAHPAD